MKAHKQTDRIIAATERKIKRFFRAKALFDELNIVPLSSIPSKRVREVYQEHIALEILAFVFLAVLDSFRAMNLEQIYKLNYKAMTGNDSAFNETLPQANDVYIERVIEDGVRKAFGQRDPERRMRDLVRRVQRYTVRVSRTEATRIENSARLNAMRDMGVKRKKWNAVIDNFTRDSHKLINGETRELEERFTNGLLYPGEPDAPPEEVVNCRCWLSPARR